jgi:hypothetical protein
MTCGICMQPMYVGVLLYLAAATEDTNRRNTTSTPTESKFQHNSAGLTCLTSSSQRRMASTSERSMCLFAPRRLETCPKVGIECVDCERWRRISGSAQNARVERRGYGNVGSCCSCDGAQMFEQLFHSLHRVTGVGNR